MFRAGSSYEVLRFAPDGDRLWGLNRDVAQEPWLVGWDFAPDPRSIEELRTIAESLAGRRLTASGGFVALATEVVRKRWQTLRAPATPAQVIVWHHRELDECVRQGERDGAFVQLGRIIELAPGQAWPPRMHALLLAEQGRWAEAATSFDRAARCGGTTTEDDAFFRATVLLLSGDQAAFRREREALLKRMAQTDDPYVANNVAWLFVIEPDPKQDWTIPWALARKATASLPPQATHRNTLGGILHRLGRQDDAVKQLNEAMDLGGNGAADWLLLALANQAAGRREVARRCQKNAQEPTVPGERVSVPGERKPIDLYGWLSRANVELLRREVEQRLKQ